MKPQRAANISARQPEPPVTVKPPSAWFRRWPFHLALLALLTLAMFADVLLFSDTRILSSGTESDLALEYIAFLKFGFGELRHGNLPLWNPHLFSGVALIGAFESGILYPLNALCLVLPIHTAVNWSIALHTFLAGAFTYAWTTRRKLEPPSCLLAAVIFMFCGASFLHVYSGSYPLLCTLTWIPLLFLAIDGMLELPSVGWGLLGSFVVAMQIFAGAPQLVFYGGLAAGMYCALNFWSEKRKLRVSLGLAAIVLGAIGLSAIQLFTSIQESHEMVRGAGVTYDYAAMFSFPPENFLTLLAPNFFGDIKTTPYWGRCYLWEMSAYIGVPGLFLAMLGATRGNKVARRFSVTMLVLLIVLALGRHTPVFHWLYDWLPGFNKFRGASKFFILASLFLAMLAGIGFNELIQSRRPMFANAIIAGIFGAALLVAAIFVHASCAHANGWWHSFMLAIRNQGESYLAPGTYNQSDFIAKAGSTAMQSLLLGGALCIATAALFFAHRKYAITKWLLLALAVGDLFFFAQSSLDSFDVAQVQYHDAKDFLTAHPGDYRILDLRDRDVALSIGAQDIWGYNPAVMLRYSQLVGATQGVPPERATQYIQFAKDVPLFDMLRLRYIFLPRNGQITIRERTNYLSHVLLISQYRVLTNRNEIFSILTSGSFNPREEVVLEIAPNPPPQPITDSDSAQIIETSTDALTIEANVSSPAILLITDSYSKNWRARGMPGSAQSSYTILPANYCLRAIPLTTGKHLIRLEYRPSAYVIGKWVSLVSIAIFLVFLIWQLWKKLRPQHS